MHIVKESDVHGDHIEAPHKRVIRHLCAPWTMDSKHIWVGTTTLEPENITNAHSHEINEEVFFCISGRGIVRIDEEEQEFYPGILVYSPAGTVHQFTNTGDEPLKYLCCVSPPFERVQFKADHEMS